MLDTPVPRRSPIPAARRAVILLLAVITVLAVPSAALARGGDDDRREARVRGGCGTGARTELRLRSRDGAIEVEFKVDHTRNRVAWRAMLVHEGRVVWRGRPRTRSGGFRVRRRVADLPGADDVTARGYGPGGLTCTATATLPG